jgi:hypothetical protein
MLTPAHSRRRSLTIEGIHSNLCQRREKEIEVQAVESKKRFLGIDKQINTPPNSQLREVKTKISSIKVIDLANTGMAVAKMKI